MSKSALRVALRADASARIGLGHVTRCLALGQALRETGVEVCLISRALGVDTRAMAFAADCDQITLDPPPVEVSSIEDDAPPHAHWARVAWRDDARQTSKALRDWAPDWVVVDHYAFDARWHRAVAAMLSARLAVIDDLGDREIDATLVVDPNYVPDHRAKYAARLAKDACLLGGPRFALLGPSYTNADHYAFNETVRSIGIFMGGTDADDMSSVALRACREYAGFDGPIEVVSTGANPHRDALASLAARWPRTSVVSDLPNLAAFFARHDLQIGAGGGSTWERCRVGVPTLAVALATNQRHVVNELAALGVLASPEPTEDLSPTVIGKALRGLLNDCERRRGMAQRSRRLVDGLGARRVALWLAAPTLTVRRADLEDAQRMYQWRNHPTTRAMSRLGAEISWPSHLDWLKQCLSDQSRSLLIGTVGSIPVGVVRFDRLAAGDVEVSLYLDPALHNLRLGSALLRAGELAVWTDCAGLVATVLDGNTASQRLFAGAGYCPVGENRWIKHSDRRKRAVQAT